MGDVADFNAKLLDRAAKASERERERGLDGPAATLLVSPAELELVIAALGVTAGHDAVAPRDRIVAAMLADRLSQ